MPDDELKRVDEVVVQRIPGRDAPGVPRLPVHADRPAAATDLLSCIRVEQVGRDPRPVGSFCGKHVEPTLNERPDLGVLGQCGTLRKERDQDVAVNETGFSGLLPSQDEREFVRAQGSTEAETVLVPARGLYLSHLEESPRVERVVVVGFVDLSA